MRRYIFLITAFVVIAIIFFGGIGVLKAIRLARTNETFAVIFLTISNYKSTLADLENQSLLVQEIHNQHPDIPFMNGKLLDAWQRPLKIDTKTEGHIFHVRLISAGPDGIYGSSDDIVMENNFNIENK